MKILNRLIGKLTGRQLDWASGALARYPFIEPHERYHLQRVAHDLLAKSGGEVFYGPIAGMKIPLESPLSNHPVLVIGCYETEIHGVLSDTICLPPPAIIDIGSAFGYYTVGLACKTKNTHIIGFEADEKIHWEKARELATLNGVAHRIEQKGFCDTEALRATIKEGAFVLCDCEGGEMQLLDPAKIPALAKCRILCEIHEFHAPGAIATLVDRFKRSHTINLIFEQVRNPSTYRILDSLSPAYRKIAVKETRFSKNVFVPAVFMDFKPF